MRLATGIPATVAAALTVLLLACGSAAAVPAPQTPAGEELAWLVETLNRSSEPSTAVLEQHFSAAFLKAVPPAKVIDVLGSIAPGQPFHIAVVRAQDGPLHLVADLESSHGATFRVALDVTATAPHLIDGLLIQPVAAQLSSWGEVDGALRKLGAHASLYAGSANGRPIHALAGNTPGAIGSAFKLYVLGALARAVEDGHARWDQVLAIRDAWKSLPSGAMRDQPAGATFSLRHYAEQMISVSDNTAADHLIHLLGRAAVEAELTALGNHSVTANEPFLTTREAFALKLAAPASLRDAYVRAGTAGRRKLLVRLDRLEPTLAEAAGWTVPREVGQIEWFASPADLAHTVAALVGEAARPGLAPLRAILSINPGIQLDARRWPYVGFKGGSEPGVISLTWYLKRADGRTFVLSIVVNDDRRDIDEAAAVSVAAAAIGLLAHTA